MTQDFFSIAHRQRAHRDFADGPVTDEEIGRLLDTAVCAPSAENKQPWEFVVVRDNATRTALGDLARRAWEGGGREGERGRLDPHLFADVDRGMTGGFATAPVMIVVCADNQRGLPMTAPESIFPAVQNLLLAATALGLGSTLTTITMAFSAESRALLDLPEHVQPMAMIPIGRPARPLGPPRRDAFERHTHRDRFGAPW